VAPGRTRFSYQSTREMFLRFVVQYDDFEQRLDVDPLLKFQYLVRV
jgi:hypothetical protein